MDTLGLSHIDVYDDFFAQGGDSLRAVSLLARVRDATGVEVPVRGFMRSPTIVGLVEQLARQALRGMSEVDASRLLDQIELLPDADLDEGAAR